MVSSVVKVKKFNHDGEEEEEDDDCGSRTGSISSSVSVPAKPERRYPNMSTLIFHRLVESSGFLEEGIMKI